MSTKQTIAPQTSTEKTYVAAYTKVLEAVGNVNRYVTRSLADQIETLEANMSNCRIEELQEYAHWYR